jgi:hypothetical protein
MVCGTFRVGDDAESFFVRDGWIGGIEAIVWIVTIEAIGWIDVIGLIEKRLGHCFTNHPCPSFEKGGE